MRPLYFEKITKIKGHCDLNVSSIVVPFGPKGTPLKNDPTRFIPPIHEFRLSTQLMLGNLEGEAATNFRDDAGMTEPKSGNCKKNFSRDRPNTGNHKRTLTIQKIPHYLPTNHHRHLHSTYQFHLHLQCSRLAATTIA